MIYVLQFICLAITVLIYSLTKKIYKTYKWTVLSPLILCPLLLILFLQLFHISYDHYAQGANRLSKLLDPAVVAFAYPLYQYRETLKKHAVQIVLNVFAGSLISIIISTLLSKLFHMNITISDSLAPHIVTTPIAMDISSMTGGTGELTALFVIMTALIGILTGPFLIRILRIRTAVAKGIMLGTSANGTGTSKAYELGPIEGTIATISMLLTGAFNVLLVPFFLEVIY